MTRSAKLTLPFALLFALMFTVLALFSQQFGLYDLIMYGDVLDLFTPLVLLTLCWWLWQGSWETAPRPGELILFLMLAALWVEGQGQTAGWPVNVGCIVQGLTYFMIIVEAGTVPLGVIIAVVLSLVVLVWGRGNLGKRPLLANFFITYRLVTILFISWAAYWGGLLEFTDPRVG